MHSIVSASCLSCVWVKDHVGCACGDLKNRDRKKHGADVCEGNRE